MALLIFCVIRRESPPPLREVGRHVVCGLVIFVGGVAFVVWAQQYISSSLASAIITTPFWFIILDKAQWEFYFASRWIIGGLLLSLRLYKPTCRDVAGMAFCKREYFGGAACSARYYSDRRVVCKYSEVPENHLRFITRLSAGHTCFSESIFEAAHSAIATRCPSVSLASA